MIILCDSKLNAHSLTGDSIHQGEIDANNILFLAPFPANFIVNLRCVLPNGVVIPTDPSAFIMSSSTINVEELGLAIATTSDLKSAFSGINAWEISIDEALTQISGQLTIQFYITSPSGQDPSDSYFSGFIPGKTYASTAVVTVVSRGVPTIPKPDGYNPSLIDVYSTAISARNWAVSAAQTSENQAMVAGEYALEAEGYAVGTQDGDPVSEESVYYQNNSKFYAEFMQGKILQFLPKDDNGNPVIPDTAYRQALTAREGQLRWVTLTANSVDTADSIPWRGMFGILNVRDPDQIKTLVNAYNAEHPNNQIDYSLTAVPLSFLERSLGNLEQSLGNLEGSLSDLGQTVGDKISAPAQGVSADGQSYALTINGSGKTVEVLIAQSSPAANSVVKRTADGVVITNTSTTNSKSAVNMETLLQTAVRQYSPDNNDRYVYTSVKSNHSSMLKVGANVPETEEAKNLQPIVRRRLSGNIATGKPVLADDAVNLKTLQEYVDDKLASPQSLSYTLWEAGQQYTVTGRGTVTGDTIVIPDTYQGLPVTQVAIEAFKNDPAKKIVFGKYIYSIGEGSLENMPNLEDVRFTAIVDERLIELSGVLDIAPSGGLYYSVQTESNVVCYIGEIGSDGEYTQVEHSENYYEEVKRAIADAPEYSNDYSTGVYLAISA